MNTHSTTEDNLVAEASGLVLRRPRLLVVDDQPVNVQALYQTFSIDHQVLMATSGEQALALCASQQPDLVLLDVVMPGMDGHEVCRHLKATAVTADIPVIFVTAHNDEAAETLGLELGAVDFISKPINPKIVRARVKTQLTLKTQSDLLKSWAYLDGLTGVHNRRHFDERLTSESARAARTGTALSLILLDVDFFKLYNDRYGHQAGDACLRRVAAALEAGLKRPGDLLARYGGEEFVCLLPDTDLSGAMVLAERLRKQVFELQIKHADSSAAPVVTVSLGVCSRSKDVFGPAAALLREADAQLYHAKSGRRNQAWGYEVNAAAAARDAENMIHTINPVSPVPAVHATCV